MAIKINPPTSFIPAGKYKGTLGSFTDLGMVDTGRYGSKHKAAISLYFDAANDDGTERKISIKMNLSNQPRSDLYKLRQRCTLTPYPDGPPLLVEEDELEGVRVGFIVQAGKNDLDIEYSYVKPEDIHPLEDQSTYEATDDLPF